MTNAEKKVVAAEAVVAGITQLRDLEQDVSLRSELDNGANVYRLLAKTYAIEQKIEDIHNEPAATSVANANTEV